MKDLIGGNIILLGVILILIGLIIKLGVPLGRLPGDIQIKGDNFSFYFPLTTSLLVSLVISLILKFLK